MYDEAGAQLRQRLGSLLARPIDAPVSDAEFDTLARDSFRYQYERNRPYAAYCAQRGHSPDTVAHWTEIPPVPTAAFKHVPLVSGDPADAPVTFRTSGTTQGTQQRGVHYLLDPSLYHAALLPMFAAYLLPDETALPMLSLLPPSSELPDSSLTHMVDVVMRELGAPDSRHYASVAGGIEEASLERDLAGRSDPVCLLGTSFSFVNWLDSLGARGQRLRLPAGSRLMDTGGYKGQGRQVSSEELSRAYADLLGIPATHCVNEYGMTELCSQQYDSHLRDRQRGVTPRFKLKRGAPWTRTRVVDAETLEPVTAGTTGIVQHFDLANLGSVIAVQTEDLGVLEDDGLRLLGRVTDAPPRGCSIAMDDMLRANRTR